MFRRRSKNHRLDSAVGLANIPTLKCHVAKSCSVFHCPRAHAVRGRHLVHMQMQASANKDTGKGLTLSASLGSDHVSKILIIICLHPCGVNVASSRRHLEYLAITFFDACCGPSNFSWLRS